MNRLRLSRAGTGRARPTRGSCLPLNRPDSMRMLEILRRTLPAMIRLGVNIDHVATVRQARGGRFPEVVAAAHAAVLGGADQITMHLEKTAATSRIRTWTTCVPASTSPSTWRWPPPSEMVEIALRVQPEHVCLVPEKREELTTEGGLDVAAHRDAGRRLPSRSSAPRASGSRCSSIPTRTALLAANEVGADAVELHTGRYAERRDEMQRASTSCRPIRRAAMSRTRAGPARSRRARPRHLQRRADRRAPRDRGVEHRLRDHRPRAVHRPRVAAVREMRELIDRAREIALRPEGG